MRDDWRGDGRMPISFRPKFSGGGGDPIGDGLRADALAYWKLDEASGTRVDATGHNFDLTDANTNTISAAGKVGSASVHVFDGSNVLYHVDDPNFRIGDVSFTWWGWILLDDITDMRGYSIVGKQNNVDTEWAVGWRAPDILDPELNTFNGYLLGGDQSFPGVFADPPNTLQVGVWYFIIFGYDADNDLIFIYQDNILEGSFSWVGGTPGTTAAFAMGGSFSAGGGGAGDFTGKLDECGFIRRVLTSDERDYLYNSGTGRTLYP